MWELDEDDETREAIKAVANYSSPVYLRFGKAAQPRLHPSDTPFEIGKAITLKDGHDITFIAIGEALAPAFAASQILEKAGFSCRVISYF